MFPAVRKLPFSPEWTTGQWTGQSSTKRFTRVRGLYVCRAAISPTHKICHSAESILKDPSHVLQPGLRQRYEPIIYGRYDQFQEGLWMLFTSNPMQKMKVVRSWARRRLTQAVIEELGKRGFDRKGRKITSGSPVEESPPKRVPSGRFGEGMPDALVGTVDVEVMTPTVEVDYKEVQKQAGLLVQEIVDICGQQQRRNE